MRRYEAFEYGSVQPVEDGPWVRYEDAQASDAARAELRGARNGLRDAQRLTQPIKFDMMRA